MSHSAFRTWIVSVALATGLIWPLPAHGFAVPAPVRAEATSAPDARASYCDGSGCVTWNVPFYTHGSVYLRTWKRCVHWEFRARVNYRVAENSTGPGGANHMVERLWLNRTSTKLQVFRYCDTEHDATRRNLGGSHVRPSVHTTNGGSTRCTMTPSIGVSFPWSVSVGVSPGCEETKIASRDSSMVSSRTQSTYRFSDVKPRKRQLHYKRYTTMLVPGDYSHPDNIACFRLKLHGSFEHPTRPGTKGFSTAKSRCVNLLDGE